MSSSEVQSCEEIDGTPPNLIEEAKSVIENMLPTKSKENKESTCMAASLTPAYIRIAGPSTSHLTFHNTSMTIHEDSSLPEPNKQKRHLGSQENESLDEENQEDFLASLKSSKDKLVKPKRHLDSQEVDSLNEENEEHFLASLKRSNDKLVKPKGHMSSQENESLDEENQDFLASLKRSKDKLVKPKRHLGSQEVDSFDEENEEHFLDSLKRSKDKMVKPKRHLSSQENESLGEESQEDAQSKFKKSTRRLVRKQRHLDISQESENMNNESHENILSKLRKSKSQGRLLTKLKRSKLNFDDKITKNRLRRSETKDNLAVSHKQWKRFVKWAKDAGFDLVFAVNNGEKTENGMWDPNPALNMLTVADKDNVEDIFWQLGYECTNQTIEDYLNDLQTLRFMVDTFSDRRWKVVGGDVTGCLQEDSKSDFKDYVTLSSEMMDAVLLNGNSSSQQLSRMSSNARLSLLRTLSASPTPLWLTEGPQPLSEMARAVDWLTSLGYSARNGFNVHFRELMENELYEPTLSFYMALLYKNLVGERVLDVTMDSPDASENNAALFAHCTSLRHKAVPGAVTLYGVNMDSEPARFSVKLAKREEGGDIMQFILGHDRGGNIVVNGRAMFYEGDIRPVVKRVRPYKTLLLNLPPKTFGFWVLANTKVDACFDYEDKDNNNITLVEAKSANDTKVKENKPSKDTQSKENETKESDDEVSDEKERAKRFVDSNDFETDVDASELNLIDNNEALKNRINSMNRRLRDIRVQGLLVNYDKSTMHRVKRQVFDEDSESRRKLRRENLKKLKHEHKLLGSGLIEKLMNNVNIPKLNLTKNIKEIKLRKPLKLNKSKLSKRNSRNYRNKEDSQESDQDEFLLRRKRSVFKNDKNPLENVISENKIDADDTKYINLGKFLHRQEKIKDLIEKHDEDENNPNGEKNPDEIEINTKLTNDDAVFKISENAEHGLVKNTLEDVLLLLDKLNNNLSKLWTSLSILD